MLSIKRAASDNQLHTL